MFLSVFMCSTFNHHTLPAPFAAESKMVWTTDKGQFLDVTFVHFRPLYLLHTELEMSLPPVVFPDH
jgi:hypothetical protein